MRMIVWIVAISRLLTGILEKIRGVEPMVHEGGTRVLSSVSSIADKSVRGVRECSRLPWVAKEIRLSKEQYRRGGGELTRESQS